MLTMYLQPTAYRLQLWLMPSRNQVSVNRNAATTILNSRLISLKAHGVALMPVNPHPNHRSESHEVSVSSRFFER